MGNCTYHEAEVAQQDIKETGTPVNILAGYYNLQNTEGFLVFNTLVNLMEQSITQVIHAKFSSSGFQTITLPADYIFDGETVNVTGSTASGSAIQVALQFSRVFATSEVNGSIGDMYGIVGISNSTPVPLTVFNGTYTGKVNKVIITATSEKAATIKINDMTVSNLTYDTNKNELFDATVPPQEATRLLLSFAIEAGKGLECFYIVPNHGEPLFTNPHTFLQNQSSPADPNIGSDLFKWTGFYGYDGASNFVSVVDAIEYTGTGTPTNRINIGTFINQQTSSQWTLSSNFGFSNGKLVFPDANEVYFLESSYPSSFPTTASSPSFNSASWIGMNYFSPIPLTTFANIVFSNAAGTLTMGENNGKMTIYYTLGDTQIFVTQNFTYYPHIQKVIYDSYSLKFYIDGYHGFACVIIVDKQQTFLFENNVELQLDKLWNELEDQKIKQIADDSIIEGGNKRVAVTGADGFIGSHIVKLLLSKGYTVHGTVQDLSPVYVEFLKHLPNAAYLTLFEGELLNDGCYDDAFKGCDCVFHVASPTLSDMAKMQNPEKMMIAQARDGTLNVLRSCTKTGVKVVVLTSSMCAATPTPCPPKISEGHWGNLKEKVGRCGWYGVSKLLAEKAAMDFHAKLPSESAFRLIRILPTFTVGPMLQPKVNSSMKRFAALCTGSLHKEIKNRSISFIDVRDTARHHVAAYEKGLEGRFFSLTEAWHWNTIYATLKCLNPEMKLPKPLDPGTKPTVRQYNTERRDRLGIKHRSVMQLLSDAVEECKTKALGKFDEEAKMVYRSPIMPNSKTVAVTGADGFIGSHIVNLLLSKGYTVHGTVRDLSPGNVEFLKLLPHAVNRLTLFKGELLHDGCYDAAFKECDCVFHVASPTLSDMAQMQNPEKMMIAQARDGTLNVLRSCIKTSVKVVVFTSSMCAACPTPCPPKITEAHWGNLKEKQGKCSWYGASKILAEKAAVDFHAQLTEESTFRLIRILPTFTVGPMLQPKVNSSMKRFASLCSGNLHEKIKNRSISFIDVRDTAAHHVAAYENGCEGRFFSVTEAWHWNVVYAALRHFNLAMPLPKPLDEGVALQPVRQYDTTRRDTLGVNHRSVMQLLTDAIEECRKKMLMQSL